MIAMLEQSDTLYTSKSGHRMEREVGTLPNGEHNPGFWVLRSPDGAMIDYDQYRYDLAARQNLRLG